MKTLLINGSTRQKQTTSGFLTKLAGFFIQGEKIYTSVRTRMDIQRVINMLNDVDNVVFSVPLYCVSVPSNILYFMEEMERYCKKSEKKFHIYVISNNGFIEGNAAEASFQIFENFAKHSGNIWGGGTGIGGGTMLLVTRISLLIWIAGAALVTLISGILSGNWILKDVLKSLLETTLMVLFFNSGAFLRVLGLAKDLNNQKFHGVHYIRGLIFKPVFAVFANGIYFLQSIFYGGLFKKQKIKDKKD